MINITRAKADKAFPNWTMKHLQHSATYWKTSEKIKMAYGKGDKTNV